MIEQAFEEKRLSTEQHWRALCLENNFQLHVFDGGHRLAAALLAKNNGTVMHDWQVMLYPDTIFCTAGVYDSSLANDIMSLFNIELPKTGIRPSEKVRLALRDIGKESKDSVYDVATQHYVERTVVEGADVRIHRSRLPENDRLANQFTQAIRHGLVGYKEARIALLSHRLTETDFDRQPGRFLHYAVDHGVSIRPQG